VFNDSKLYEYIAAHIHDRLAHREATEISVNVHRVICATLLLFIIYRRRYHRRCWCTFYSKNISALRLYESSGRYAVLVNRHRTRLLSI